MTGETGAPASDLPSGEQFEINAGAQRATIVEVGGGLREYEVDGRPVLEPYAADRMRDGAHGAPLIPCPNRLEDGRYSFDGTTYQVPLTEPEKRNAIHGFLLWQPWEAAERDADRVVMTTHLYPREGYPFTLGIRISYELGPKGLKSSMRSSTLISRRWRPTSCRSEIDRGVEIEPIYARSVALSYVRVAHFGMTWSRTASLTRRSRVQISPPDYSKARLGNGLRDFGDPASSFSNSARGPVSYQIG
jgi:Aldose 1-epimerase